MGQITSLADSDLVARMETVVTTDLDGEVIMMNVETGNYFHLDDIATDVWNLLDRPQTIDAVVSGLREIYDVSQEDCRRDVGKLVAELCEAGVLKVDSR